MPGAFARIAEESNGTLQHADGFVTMSAGTVGMRQENELVGDTPAADLDRALGHAQCASGSRISSGLTRARWAY